MATPAAGVTNNSNNSSKSATLPATPAASSPINPIGKVVTNTEPESAKKLLVDTAAKRQISASSNTQSGNSCMKKTWKGFLSIPSRIKKVFQQFTCCQSHNQAAIDTSAAKPASTATSKATTSSTQSTSSSFSRKAKRFFKGISYRLTKLGKKVSSIFCSFARKPAPVAPIGVKKNPIVASKPNPKPDLYKLFEDTQKASVHGVVINLDEEQTKKMQEGTLVINSTEPLDPKKYPPKYAETTVKVYPQDVLLCALNLILKGYNPLVENLANKDHALGHVGAMAQEEAISYRSNYWQSLYPDVNPTLAKQLAKDKDGKPIYLIPEKGCIFTPGVQVFRKTRDQGYGFMQPFTVDLAACAAYNMGVDSPPTLEQYTEGTREKMRTKFRVAIMTGHDSVLCGASGCGVFGQDPNQVASFAKQVLEEPEFRGQFKHVGFAVLEDVKGNYQAFRDKLDNLKIPGVQQAANNTSKP